MSGLINGQAIEQGTFPRTGIDQNFENDLQSLEINSAVESPSTTWSHTNIYGKITLASNLNITSVATLMPIGSTIKYFIHSGYSLTVLGVTNFTDYNGKYRVVVENIGTPSVPDYVVIDGWKSYGGIEEAPVDNDTYGRKNMGWVPVSGGTGGGSLQTDPLVISSTEVLVLFSSGKTLSTAPGVGLLDNVKECWAYVDYKGTPYSGSTILNLYSGNVIIGTCDCLGVTSSGWHKFTWEEGISQLNSNLTVRAAGSDPYGGNSHLGLVAYYEQIDLGMFTFPPDVTSEIMYDDFTGSVIDTTTKWTLVNPSPTRVSYSINNNQLEITNIGTTTTTAGNDYLVSQASVNSGTTIVTAMDFVSTTSLYRNPYFGIWKDWQNRASIYRGTEGDAHIYVFTGNTQQYWFDTNVPLYGNRWKVSIDPSNNIKFYHFSGGTWNQKGVTQNYNIGATRKAFIAANSSTTFSGTTMVFDRFRMDNEDYLTELP